MQKKKNFNFLINEFEILKKVIFDFLDFLKKNYDGKSVAIVAHKAPQLVLDVLLKNKPMSRHRVFNFNNVQLQESISREFALFKIKKENLNTRRPSTSHQ